MPSQCERLWSNVTPSRVPGPAASTPAPFRVVSLWSIRALRRSRAFHSPRSLPTGSVQRLSSSSFTPRPRAHAERTVAGIRSNGPVDLIAAGFPSDPVLDVALSNALLREVAAGRRNPTLRIFRPGPTVAFGRLDALRPGFAEACARARQHGFTPVVRSAGGHAAAYDERCLVVEHVSAEADATAGLQARFAAQASHVHAGLAALGADVRIGELPGEYCPGAHSLNVGGRVKVAGIAQRTTRHGALTTAVVVVSGGPDVRAVIASVYAALDIDVDLATAGSLDEDLPGATADAVARAIQHAYAADWLLEPHGVDAELIAAARALTPRHRPP